MKCRVGDRVSYKAGDRIIFGDVSITDSDAAFVKIIREDGLTNELWIYDEDLTIHDYGLVDIEIMLTI